jgi:hypothetical protein
MVGTGAALEIDIGTPHVRETARGSKEHKEKNDGPEESHRDQRCSRRIASPSAIPMREEIIAVIQAMPNPEAKAESVGLVARNSKKR